MDQMPLDMKLKAMAKAAGNARISKHSKRTGITPLTPVLAKKM
ncbi:hypothetical protein [Selenomonas ruminantium]|nr:hypothetical protein [Selenomonas ruminantium]